MVSKKNYSNDLDRLDFFLMLSITILKHFLNSPNFIVGSLVLKTPKGASIRFSCAERTTFCDDFLKIEIHKIIVR